MSTMYKDIGIECFNKCWELIDKNDRNPIDNENMRRLAEVSLWGWENSEEATDENYSVSYWQLSRVYTISGREDMGDSYADKCLDISKDLAPFFQGYAYEAKARAQKALGNQGACAKFLALAQGKASLVEELDNKEVLEVDLKTL